MSAPSSTTSSSTWQLELLGVARVVRDGMALESLDRRSAGLLAVLALDGPTPRSRLAGLLWPDSPEDAARANLRQRLKRLRTALGDELVIPDDILRLRPDVLVDAVQLESLAFTGEYSAALKLEGELLAGFDFDDSPELEEWLIATRERLGTARREALAAEASRLEEAGDLSAALRFALQLLELDPLSEEAHRQVMRLHALRGDRANALRAFERCRNVLHEELGLKPLPETLELARVIEQDAPLNSTMLPNTGAPRPAIPTFVLRPPQLVGREREWVALEAAWDARQVMIVRGQPGAGKTRLVLDVLHSHGEHVFFEGRPGDESVSYATLSRGIKAVLDRFPLHLEAWERRELSRLVPFLQPDPPPPIASDAEKLRFLEAVGQVLERLSDHGAQAVAVDDLQFMDSASFEAVLYLSARLTSKLRLILSYRDGELDPDAESRLRESFQTGRGLIVHLQPLERDAVQQLIESLGVPDALPLTERLHQHAGGNPMFVLETVKTLFETNAFGAGLPERLPLPDRIQAVIRRRLDRLSPAALRMARVAAVSGTEFSTALAAHVLDTHPLDLAEPISQLEAAQVMTSNRFAHDLIFESTLAGVPNTIRSFIHHRVAQYLQNTMHLETVQHDPERLAHHWLGAGDEARAVPALIAAGHRQKAQFELMRSAATLEQAGGILERLGKPTEAFEAYRAALESRDKFDLGETRQHTIDRLIALATTPIERALAWRGQAVLFSESERYQEGIAAARRAHGFALESSDQTIVLEALFGLALALGEAKQHEESLEVFLQSRALARDLQDTARLAHCESSIGVLYDRMNRFSEALDHHRRAIGHFRTIHEPRTLTESLGNLSASLADSGLNSEAITHLDEALTLLGKLGEDRDLQFMIFLNRIAVLISLCRFSEGLELIGTLESLEATYPSQYRHHIRQNKLELLVHLGQSEAARGLAQQIRHTPSIPAGRRIYSFIYESLIEPGPHNLALILEAEAMNPNRGPLSRPSLNVVKMPCLPPQDAFELGQEIIAVALRYEAEHLILTAETRSAQALLALGRAEEALQMSQAAMQRLETRTPVLAYSGEVMFTHHRALETVSHADMHSHLERSLAWVMNINDQHVPTGYREGFLNGNHWNRLILKAANQHGLTHK
jgi:DNA-binding SARP family transcriptional activator